MNNLNILLSGPAGIGDLFLMGLIWIVGPILLLYLGIRSVIRFMKK